MKAETNGININYEIYGREEGDVIMFSHSLGTNLLMWDPQIKALKDRYKLLCFDTRGHGESDVPDGPYTLEELAKDAVGLLDVLGIKKVHWVGLSMGGMIAQAVALNHPERLKSLILCDTAAKVNDEDQPIWQQRIDAVLEHGMSALLQPTLERWFTPSFLEKDPPVVDLIRKLFLSTPVKGFVGCAEAIRRLNYLDRLSEISLPTLIMVGEQDMGTPVEVSQEMNRRIADSELVIIPSAAHLSNLEQPERFNAALLDFLDKNT